MTEKTARARYWVVGKNKHTKRYKKVVYNLKRFRRLFSYQKRANLNCHHVLRAFRVVQAWPAGQDLAGCPLGQKADKGSRFWDGFGILCPVHHSAQSQNGAKDNGTFVAGWVIC